MDWMQQLMQMLTQSRGMGPRMAPMPQMGMPQTLGQSPWGIPPPPPPLPPAFIAPPRPLPQAPVAAARKGHPLNPINGARGVPQGIPVGGGGGPGQERNNGMNAQFYQGQRLGNVMQPRQGR